MKCFVCKGEIENKETTFEVELNGKVITVNNVPSSVCSKCGEITYNDDVVRQLQRMVNYSS